MKTRAISRASAEADVALTALDYDAALARSEDLARAAADARHEARLRLSIHRAACAVLRTVNALQDTRKARPR